jgi:hypothetical protein
VGGAELRVRRKRYRIFIDGEPVTVTVHFESRLIRVMKALRLLPRNVVGFAPRNIHLSEPYGEVTRSLFAHECCHMLDRETAPFPRLITHPLRSLWAMRRGYRNSEYERRAFAVQDAIVAGEYERVVIPEEVLGEFR